MVRSHQFLNCETLFILDQKKNLKLDNFKQEYTPEDSYHHKFSEKMKEVHTSSARNITSMPSGQKIREKAGSSRNLVVEERRQLNSRDVRGAYGTQNTAHSSHLDMGDAKLINGSHFQKIKFNLDKINPIIRKLNTRRGSESTVYA